MKAGGLLALTVIVLATAMAARAMEEPPIYEKKCFNCHSIGGVGGRRASKGGELDGVGSKRDEAWIRAYLQDPRSQVPDAKMRQITLSPEDTEALVRYMMSLK